MNEMDNKFNEIVSKQKEKFDIIMKKIENIENKLKNLENIPMTTKELFEDDWAQKSKALDKMRDDLVDAKGLKKL